MSRRSVKSNLPPPFLKRLSFIEERVKADEFPFTIPAFQRGKLQLGFPAVDHHHRGRERHRQIDTAGGYCRSLRLQSQRRQSQSHVQSRARSTDDRRCVARQLVTESRK